MKDFLKLPINKIIKDEKTYEDYFKNRIKRFVQWSPKDSNMPLHNRFQNCIDASKETREFSKKLLKSINLLKDIVYSKTLPDIIEEIADRNYNETKHLENKLPEDIAERIRKMNIRSKEILIKGVEGNKKFENLTINEFLDKELENLEHWEESGIRQSFLTLYLGLETEMTKINSYKNLIFIGEIIRGILFSGIFNIEGRKLERKVLIEDLKDIGNEVVGIVIPVGLINSIVKLVNDFYGSDITPKLIDDAAYIDSYLKKYELLIHDWMIIANYATTIIEPYNLEN